MNTIDLLWELTEPATNKLGVLLRPDKFLGTEVQPELDDEGKPYFTLRKLYEVLDVDSIEIVLTFRSISSLSTHGISLIS